MTTWLIVAALALILLGPKQMPSAVRKIARMMGKKDSSSEAWPFLPCTSIYHFGLH